MMANNPLQRLRRLLGIGYKPPKHRPIWVWKRFYLCSLCRGPRVVARTREAVALHVVSTGHQPPRAEVVWECNRILHVLSVLAFSRWWERVPFLRPILIMTTCKAHDLQWARNDWEPISGRTG